MANGAILLLQKDDPSSTAVSIVDTTANINALWITASTLVDGYMDFTSYQTGLYARYADGYIDPQLTDLGNFTGKGTLNGVQHFDAGIPIDGQVTDAIPIDGNPADLAETQVLVNSIRTAVINLANAQPVAS